MAASHGNIQNIHNNAMRLQPIQCGSSSTWIERIGEYTITAVSILIKYPLRHLYLHGPEFELPFVGKIGFWRGRPLPHICAALMGPVQVDWSLPANNVVCHDQIEQQLDSWICGILFAMYCCAFAMTIRHLYYLVMSHFGQSYLSLSTLSTSTPSLVLLPPHHQEPQSQSHPDSHSQTFSSSNSSNSKTFHSF